jgi:hypothetical protein
VILVIILYFFVCKKGCTKRDQKAPQTELSTRAEPRKIEATVTVNPGAGDLDLENSRGVNEKSEDEDPNVSKLSIIRNLGMQSGSHHLHSALYMICVVFS